MEWERTNVMQPVIKTAVEQKSEPCPTPSTEGMPPLSDITKHKGKRRNRTGSLNAHYGMPETREREPTTVPKMPPLTRIRRTPITVPGTSWDDNSVGHGSVVSRIRRERNRAVLRTQSSVMNPLYHSVDTHANITSTLNLINTTALSPLPSDSFHDNSEWLNYFWGTQHQPSAAAKSSAGSMCNIPVSGYQAHSSKQTWDTLSIPELHSTKSCDRTCHRTHHRHSYSSGYANLSHLHSSPTSGCASIASSDLDSADFRYFSINDDSSYFDGDSLFADSLGIIGDNDTAFSTNILSLLEEGSISCRTPFPASDWPDSISELDFDCSEGKSDDVTNCDALSDIGPSCSSPPQRRRMTKRQSMTQSKSSEVELNDDDLDDQPCVADAESSESDGKDKNRLVVEDEEDPEPLTPTECMSGMDSTLLMHPMTESIWSCLTDDDKDEYVKKLTSTMSQKLSPEEQFDVMQLLLPSVVSGAPHSGQITSKDIDFPRLEKALKYLEQRRNCVDCDWVLVQSPEQKNGTIRLVKQKKVMKYGVEVQPSNGFTQKRNSLMEFDSNLHNDSSKFNFQNGDSSKYKLLEPLKSPPLCDSTKFKTQKCNSTKIYTDSARNFIHPVKYYDDSAKITQRHSRKLTLDDHVTFKSRNRPESRQDTSSTRSADPQHADSCSDPSCTGCASSLRRSNSDGNLPKSVGAEAQKEHRRQQRQARRWAKWLKTRQRKENRQLKKEHRSGLFVNERKVKLKVDCEEEIEVEVS